MTGRWHRDEAGALSLEMVVLTPVLLGCILAIAGGARFVDAENQVSSAAAAAARAASLQSNPEEATTAGHQAARQSLADRGKACADLRVVLDTDQFIAGGVVRATVTCRADLSDLAGFGLPGSKTFTSQSVVPLEKHRVLP